MSWYPGKYAVDAIKKKKAKIKEAKKACSSASGINVIIRLTLVIRISILTFYCDEKMIIFII